MAIDGLAAENRVLRRQGKGSFVATHHEAKVRCRFLRLAPADGKSTTSGSRMLDVRRPKARADVSALLGLRAGATVVNLRRLLSFDASPTILDDIWLPGAPFRGLTAELLETSRSPLYALFESEYGVSMVRAEEKLKAVAADDTQAELLAVPAGHPL